MEISSRQKAKQEQKTRLRYLIRKQRIDIVREVAVRGAGQARHKAVEHLERTEVEFDHHARAVTPGLEFCGEPFHVRPRLGEKDSLVLNIELLREPCRKVSGITDEDAEKSLVQLHDDGTIIRVPRGEAERKHLPFEIRRDVHFEPVKPAFSGLSPAGEEGHGFVMLRLSYRADGNVGRVDMLYGTVVMLPVCGKEERKHDTGDLRETHHIHDEGLVRTPELFLEDVEEGPLRRNVVLLLEEREGEDVGDGNREFPTFGFLLQMKIELPIQEVYFLLDLFI